MHDAGNPPFTHLAEPYLEAITGHNGETFLTELLDKQTASVLHRYGISDDSLVQFVAGENKPFSDVLHGSLDIDNLDNIARWAAHLPLKIQQYDGPAIARSLQFKRGKGWSIAADQRDNCAAWQAARRAVYASIYGQPHIAAVAMLNRAMDITFRNGSLKSEFFRLNDAGGVQYLRRANPWSHNLVTAILQKRLYRCVWSIETNKPSVPLQRLAESWENKAEITDEFAMWLDIPHEKVCLIASRGRDFRAIRLPFREEKQLPPEAEPPPVYRGMLFIPPEFKRRPETIQMAVERYF